MSHPYKISLNEDNGLYLFTTEQGLIYNCAFKDVTNRLSPLMGAYDIRVIDFDFEPYNPLPGRRLKQDERISDTIVELLSAFFAKDETGVITFVCDSSDGRGLERQTLFTDWHQNAEDAISFIPITITLESDGSSAYGGVLTRNDFPHKDVLQTEIIEKAQGIIREKYGH